MTPGPVLVTGATGAVGAQVVEEFRSRGIDVTACSRRGLAGRGVHSWDLAQRAPDSLRKPWAVIVHAAASTRWNMTVAEARHANLDSVNEVAELATETGAHLVFVSTAYAVGADGRGGEAREGYRNAYEWSKRQAELRLVRRVERLSIVRLPLVIGRQDDGAIARFSGSYALFQGLATGLLAAIVGSPDARVELAPVDVCAKIICDLALATPIGAAPRAIGANSAAPTLEQVFSIACDEINAFRGERGQPPISSPPTISRERWTRFFLPFCRDELSPLQLHAVTLLSEFHNYTSDACIYEADALIADPLPALRRSLRYWAECHETLALRAPRAWA